MKKGIFQFLPFGRIHCYTIWSYAVDWAFCSQLGTGNLRLLITRSHNSEFELWVRYFQIYVYILHLVCMCPLKTFWDDLQPRFRVVYLTWFYIFTFWFLIWLIIVIIQFHFHFILVIHFTCKKLFYKLNTKTKLWWYVQSQTLEPNNVIFQRQCKTNIPLLSSECQQCIVNSIGFKFQLETF